MSDSESLQEVAAKGVKVATLEALRDRLAAAIDAEPPARDLAALSRQLTLVLDSLAEAAPPAKKKGGSFLDRLAERDADRQPGASAS